MEQGSVLLLMFSSPSEWCATWRCDLQRHAQGVPRSQLPDIRVSNDTPRTMGAYSESLSIKFHMLSDTGAKMAVPWTPGGGRRSMAGVPQRSEFMIDRKGSYATRMFPRTPTGAGLRRDIGNRRMLAKEYEEEDRTKG